MATIDCMCLFALRRTERPHLRESLSLWFMKPSEALMISEAFKSCVFRGP
jgi:hypothetical protein